jgi:hypothetical protein
MSIHSGHRNSASLFQGDTKKVVTGKRGGSDVEVRGRVKGSASYS